MSSQNENNLHLVTYHGAPCLADHAGGVWWPTDEVAEQLLAIADEDERLAKAIEIQGLEGTGEWAD